MMKMNRECRMQVFWDVYWKTRSFWAMSQEAPVSVFAFLREVKGWKAA